MSGELRTGGPAFQALLAALPWRAQTPSALECFNPDDSKPQAD